MLVLLFDKEVAQVLNMNQSDQKCELQKVAQNCFFCIKDYRYINKDLVNNHVLYDFYLKCHLLYEI